MNYALNLWNSLKYGLVFAYQNFIKGSMDFYLLSSALLNISWHISLLNGD
jgi:hypothetical protein